MIKIIFWMIGIFTLSAAYAAANDERTWDTAQTIVDACLREKDGGHGKITPENLPSYQRAEYCNCFANGFLAHAQEYEAAHGQIYPSAPTVATVATVAIRESCIASTNPWKDIGPIHLGAGYDAPSPTSWYEEYLVPALASAAIALGAIFLYLLRRILWRLGSRLD